MKLLDKLLHEMPQSAEEQIVVVSQVHSQSFFFMLKLITSNVVLKQLSYVVLTFLFPLSIFKVLVADINIGYEDIVNTQVSSSVCDILN